MLEPSKRGPTRVQANKNLRRGTRDEFATAGGQAGRLVRLGDLKWGADERTIIELEGEPPPLEREMITPRDLALLPQLELVKSFGIRVP